MVECRRHSTRMRACDLRFLDEWEAVRGVLSRWAPDVVVLDLEGAVRVVEGGGGHEVAAPLSSAFEEIRGPTARLLLGVSPREVLPPAALIELARLGLVRVVSPEVARRPRRFREVLLQLLRSRLEARVLGRLQAGLGRPLPSEIERCLEVGLWAEGRITCEEVARRVYSSRSTLARRLREANLPPLGTFILRCRLIRAAALLEDPETTGETAARRVGCHSAGHLSNLFGRHLRGGIGEARQEGVEGVTKALLL